MSIFQAISLDRERSVGHILLVQARHRPHTWIGKFMHLLDRYDLQKEDKFIVMPMELGIRYPLAKKMLRQNGTVAVEAFRP